MSIASDARTRFEHFLSELEKQPVGITQTNHKDFIFNKCLYSFVEVPAGSFAPADFAIFKSRLKSVAARPGEHPYYQGIALLITGFVLLGRMVPGQFEFEIEFRKALRAWESLSPQQLQEKAWFLDDDGVVKESSLKVCLDKKWRRDALLVIEGLETGLDEAKQEAMQLDPLDALWKICRATGVEKLSSKAKCDSCGERNPALKKCESCRMEWYCSRECQRIAWKAGHKQFCRPHDKFKTGDFVWLDGLPSSLDWDRQFAFVEDFDEERGRWIVSSDVNRRASIKPENLTRMMTVEEVRQIHAKVAERAVEE
ncbi:hypothetical protein HDU98_008647 [Podochytrium sp. JEL0797]|nr:hypothetical protein HDU98_008647 [Podochytrium sp. JEL0797]